MMSLYNAFETFCVILALHATFVLWHVVFGIGSAVNILLYWIFNGLFYVDFAHSLFYLLSFCLSFYVGINKWRQEMPFFDNCCCYSIKIVIQVLTW